MVRHVRERLDRGHDTVDQVVILFSDADPAVSCKRTACGHFACIRVPSQRSRCRLSGNTRPTKFPVRGRRPGHHTTRGVTRERARRPPASALLPWTTSWSAGCDFCSSGKGAVLAHRFDRPRAAEMDADGQPAAPSAGVRLSRKAGAGTRPLQHAEAASSLSVTTPASVKRVHGQCTRCVRRGVRPGQTVPRSRA
jgi:hypothetical protein